MNTQVGAQFQMKSATESPVGKFAMMSKSNVVVISSSGHSKVSFWRILISSSSDRLTAFFKEHPGSSLMVTMNEVAKLHRARLGKFDCHVQPSRRSKGTVSPKKHVVYVWIDALINYITALGYGQDEHGNFDLFWQNGENHEIIHMIEVRIFFVSAQSTGQSSLWLFVCCLPLVAPRLVRHEDVKMSKSKGNVIYPNVGDVLRCDPTPLLPHALVFLSVSDGTFTPRRLWLVSTMSWLMTLRSLLQPYSYMIKVFRWSSACLCWERYRLFDADLFKGCDWKYWRIP